MKICKNCSVKKDFSLFRKLARNVDGYDSDCKECRRIKDKNTYYNNLNKSRKDAIKYKNKTRDNIRDLVYKYLLNKECLDCGISNPVLLEFDHKVNKKFTIGNMLKDGVSKETLFFEIEKCDIRCCNCHRLKTAKDFKYYRYTKYYNTK
jgi:hypothetical protein